MRISTWTRTGRPTWSAFTVAEGLGLGFAVRLSPSLQRLLNGGADPIVTELSGRLQEKLVEQGTEIIREAKTLCPVETGALRASGRVELLAASNTSFGVNLSFGGEAGSGNVDGESNATDVDYAVIVHEDMTMRHPNGGQAKFLEQPWLEAQPQKLEEQKEVVRDVLREMELA